MIKGPKLRLKAIAPRMVQKTLRELSYAIKKNAKARIDEKLNRQ